MTLDPVLIEALEAVIFAVAASGIVAPLAATLKRIIGGSERTVAVRFPDGKEIRLELDKHLSREEMSELVAAAVHSAQSGDEAAVLQTVDASHAASKQAREAASG